MRHAYEGGNYSYQHVVISKPIFVSTLQDFLLNEALDCNSVQAPFDGFVRDVTSKTSITVTELVRHKTSSAAELRKEQMTPFFGFPFSTKCV